MLLKIIPGKSVKRGGFFYEKDTFHQNHLKMSAFVRICPHLSPP